MKLHCHPMCMNYSTAYNHTCVSVRLRDAENSARSAIDRYCRSRNFLSSASSCCVVNGVRGFRFVLCLRRRHFCGVNRGGLPNPRHTNTPNFRIRNINSRQPSLCGCGSTHLEYTLPTDVVAANSLSAFRRLLKRVFLFKPTYTGHRCCRQAASQVSHTATDGGPPTSANHCRTPSIRCARPHGLELLA